MAGIWSTANPPTRPGAYFNFRSAAQDNVAVGVTGTTALVGQADWGPHNEVRAVYSQAEFDTLYGRASSSLRDAVNAAFDGLQGGGANTLLVYRVTASAAAKATVTINGQDSNPAIVLTAKYAGTRPNSAWSITIQTNANDSAQKDVILYESGVELERFTALTNTNDEIVEAVNATSQYLTGAVSGADARAMSNIVGVAGGAGGLAGGDSGASFTGNDFADALTALEPQEFNTVAVANLTDSTMRTALATWVVDMNDNQGKRIFGVVGGEEAESYSDAVTRSDALDDANIINLGATNLRRLSDDVVLSTAELAPRVAGAVAGIGIRRSLTYMLLPGYQVNNPLNNATYTDAIDQGVLVFTNHTTDTVRVEAGVTSLQTTNTSDRPVAYKQIRNVYISHFIQTQLTAVANANYIGQVPNSDTARRDLVGNFTAFLKALEDQNVLQPGSEVSLDDRFEQAGNAVYVAFAVRYVDSIERIFTTVQIGRS
jgi:hypothetical protein